MDHALLGLFWIPAMVTLSEFDYYIFDYQYTLTK